MGCCYSENDKVRHVVDKFPMAIFGRIEASRTPQRITGVISPAHGHTPLASPASPNHATCVFYKVYVEEQFRHVRAMTGGGVQDQRLRYETRYSWEFKYQREQGVDFILTAAKSGASCANDIGKQQQQRVLVPLSTAKAAIKCCVEEKYKSNFSVGGANQDGGSTTKHTTPGRFALGRFRYREQRLVLGQTISVLGPIGSGSSSTSGNVISSTVNNSNSNVLNVSSTGSGDGDHIMSLLPFTATCVDESMFKKGRWTSSEVKQLSSLCDSSTETNFYILCDEETAADFSEFSAADTSTTGIRVSSSAAVAEQTYDCI